MSFLKKMKRNKKKEADKEFEKAVNMYTNLPKQCNMCQEPFDKNDKDMLKTWQLTVKKAIGETNLYCPKCWNMAIEAVKEGFTAAINGEEEKSE